MVKREIKTPYRKDLIVLIGVFHFALISSEKLNN